MVKWGKKNAKTRASIRDRIVKYYREGEKVDWIAVTCGCSSSYVSKVALQCGLCRNPSLTRGDK